MIVETMTHTEVYEELAGRTLSDKMELYRNNLILWNVQLENEPIVVEKVCGPMDIIPTLLNLFGFHYDSRLYAGRDIFSDEEGMVIFNDRSFVTDSVIYNRKTKQAWWKLDHGEDTQGYLEQKQRQLELLKNRCQIAVDKFWMAMPEIAEQFTKQTKSRRFAIN